MTAGLVLGDGFEAEDAVAALRPHARVLMVSADESDVVELLQRRPRAPPISRDEEATARSSARPHSAADEGRRPQDRRRRGLGLPDRADRRPGRRGHRLGGRHGRREPVGAANPFEVTMDQMLVVTQAVRRGVSRALLSATSRSARCRRGTTAPCGPPSGSSKRPASTWSSWTAASDFLDSVTAVTRAGIPVFAQFGITPQTALRYGVELQRDPVAGRSGARGDDRTPSSPRPSGSRTRAPSCSTSPTPGRSSEPPSPRPSPFRSSEASAAARGSTAGCAWRTPPSATPHRPSTTPRTPTRTSRRRRSTPSRPMPRTCVPHVRSPAASAVRPDPTEVPGTNEEQRSCPPPLSTGSPRVTRWPVPGRRC